MGCLTNYVWNGVMSWFCCGNAWGPCGAAGYGACGTCDSGNYQCAWINISDACLNNTDPMACGLPTPPRYGCGDYFYVTDRCTGKCVYVTIADCGPCTACVCNQAFSCGSYTKYNRQLDLTPAAFSAVDNLDNGLAVFRIDR